MVPQESEMFRKLNGFFGGVPDSIARARQWASSHANALKGALKRKPKPTLEPDNRRRAARFKIQRPVYFSGETAEGDGQVVNISLHGCAISTAIRVKPGAVLRLEMSLVDQEAPLQITVAARWTSEGCFGTEFVEIDSESNLRLRRYLAKLGNSATSKPSRP